MEQTDFIKHELNPRKCDRCGEPLTGGYCFQKESNVAILWCKDCYNSLTYTQWIDDGTFKRVVQQDHYETKNEICQYGECYSPARYVVSIITDRENIWSNKHERVKIKRYSCSEHREEVELFGEKLS